MEHIVGPLDLPSLLRLEDVVAGVRVQGRLGELLVPRHLNAIEVRVDESLRRRDVSLRVDSLVRCGVAHHLPLLIEVNGTVLLRLVLPLRTTLLLPIAIPVLRRGVLVHTALAIGVGHQIVYAELRLLLETVLGVAVQEVVQLLHDFVLAEALLALLHAHLPLQ